MSRRDGTPWPTCIECNEPDSAGCPGWRCRDCDIEHVMARASCRECRVFIAREEYAGPRAAQHKAGCSLATTDDYGPLPTHDDVWKAALGTLADTADDYEREADALAAGDLRGDVLRAVVGDLRARAERWRPPAAAPAAPDDCRWANVPDEVRATVEAWSREQDAACNARRCPKCRGDLTRNTDPTPRGHADR